MLSHLLQDGLFENLAEFGSDNFTVFLGSHRCLLIASGGPTLIDRHTDFAFVQLLHRLFLSILGLLGCGI